jgi:hypothetical protein
VEVRLGPAGPPDRFAPPERIANILLMIRWPLVLPLIALAACSEGAPTAASIDHSVEGTWILTASVRGGLADCYIGGVELLLTPTDSGFGGSTAGGAVVCADGQETIQIEAPPRRVFSGTVTGDSVWFSLAVHFSSYIGVFDSEDVMRGELVEGVGARQNRGVWRATRK